VFRRSAAQFKPTVLWTDLTPREWLFRKLAFGVWMPPCTWLISRELTEASGAWELIRSPDDDGEYFCRVIAKSNGVRFIPEAKCFYRHSGSSHFSHIGRDRQKMDAYWHSLESHIAHLRAYGDDAEARQACVFMLQRCLLTFIPDRLDIAQRANELAVELGGKLEPPQFSWKYAWIKALFGWNLAKHAQLLLLRIRWGVTRAWDRLLNRFEE
jgi:hypothetical protein